MQLPPGRTLQLIYRASSSALLALAAVFFALHYLHLAADFPNYSPWMDWSKYTDEGWYGDAAIRHFQRGSWYVPGDFNPAAALPVLPFLEAIVFQFTGVSAVAARAFMVTVFAGILLASYLLLRRWSPPRSLSPSCAVFLLALSPFCFVFTRIAIIEPLLSLLMLLTLLATGTERHPSKRTILALGILLPAMVLAKTTGLFLVPAVAWLLFASTGYRLRPFLRIGLPAAFLGIGLWVVYFLALVRPHYLQDYRYLFSANAYTGMTRANAISVLQNTFIDGNWMGGTLFAFALISILIACFNLRRLREYPLVPTLILWAAGYTAFLAYHNNLQPRYYLVVAIPLTLLVPYTLEFLLPARVSGFDLKPAQLLLLAGCTAAIAIPDAIQTVHFLTHPEYTFIDAAHNIRTYIDSERRHDPTRNNLILSISGSDISLFTGLPSICDDFGTLELVDRVRKYHPGWYVAWNQIEDDKMDALSYFFTLHRVAVFPAMDDSDRDQLILYRLDALPPAPPPTQTRPRKRLGQKPSPAQLKH